MIDDLKAMELHLYHCLVAQYIEYEPKDVRYAFRFELGMKSTGICLGCVKAKFSDIDAIVLHHSEHVGDIISYVGELR